MKLDRNLEYRKGSSDKIYIVRLYKNSEHWVVDCWYGRRSGPYTHFRKFANNSCSLACAAYEGVLLEKMNKGYTDFEDFTLPGPWDNVPTQEKKAESIHKEEKIFDSDCRVSSDDERQKALARLTNSGW